jgi:hypothetical protein
MHLVFYLFLRVEQDLYGIKWMFSININNGNNIEDYIAYVKSLTSRMDTFIYTRLGL